MLLSRKTINLVLQPATFPATSLNREQKCFTSPLKFLIIQLFHAFIAVTEAPPNLVLRTRRLCAAHSYHRYWIAPTSQFELLPVLDDEQNRSVVWAFGVAMATLVMRERKQVRWQTVQRRNLPSGPDFHALSPTGLLVWEAKGTSQLSPTAMVRKATNQLKNKNIPSTASKYALVTHACPGRPARVIVADPPDGGGEPTTEQWLQGLNSHYRRLLIWCGFQPEGDNILPDEGVEKYRYREEERASGRWYDVGDYEVFLGLRDDVLERLHRKDLIGLLEHDSADEITPNLDDLSAVSIHGDGFVMALRQPEKVFREVAIENLFRTYFESLEEPDRE